jgi:HD-GYP domain-containing protein (c-di-GMP phosphodiesterase class II)
MSPSSSSPASGSIRTAQLLGAFSVASDLAFGFQLEDSIRSCYLSLRLAKMLGLPDEEHTTVFYTTLMKDAGCTCWTSDMAAFLMTDEIEARKQVLLYGEGQPDRFPGWVERNVGVELPPAERQRTRNHVLEVMPTYMLEGFRTSCDVASRIAMRLGMPESVRTAVLALFENWDGSGAPNGLAGESVPVAARVVGAAFVAVPLYRRFGKPAFAEFARSQSGRELSPDVADALLDLAAEQEFWDGLESNSIWEDVLAMEPASALTWCDDSKVEDLAYALSDFIDLKSPYIAAHSRRVARIAEQIAVAMGCSQDETALIRRAALTHDLGLVGVPSFSLNKPEEKLSHAEREQRRLHPYHAERILAGVPAVAGLAPIAGSHHERFDGTGYFRGLRGREIPLGSRIIAVADRLDELTHDAPGRAAADLPDVLRVLAQEAGTILDGDIVAAIRRSLGALPITSPAAGKNWPAGLTSREVEVLRLASRGMTRKQIGEALSITENTARHHLEHIYTKTGTSTRVAVTLFAMEHDLLP